MNTSKGSGSVVYLDPPYTVRECPLEWQRQGLQQTASGYGSRLTTRYVLTAADRRQRRIYAICWTNCASYYVRVKGERLFLRDGELEAARDAGR